MNAILAPSLGRTCEPLRTRRAQRFDTGTGHRMTVSEIARATGCTDSSIYARIETGDTGPALLRPRRCKLFDAGGELLSIKQIMQRTGLGETAVRARIARGATGRALLRKGRKDAAAPRSSTMVIACRLADRYPDRLPTTKEIRAIYPMTRQSAERWLTALRAARQKQGAT